MFREYGYYMKMNKGNSPVIPMGARLTDFSEISHSPNGVYRWLMYVHKRTVKICCKHIYPSLPFVSNQLCILHELLESMPTTTSQTIMLLAGGEFRKQSDVVAGTLANLFTINTLSDESTNLEVLNEPYVSPRFMLFAFSQLGRNTEQPSLYSLDMTDVSYLDRPGNISLTQFKFHLMEYALLYGYSVYEFPPSKRRDYWRLPTAVSMARRRRG